MRLGIFLGIIAGLFTSACGFSSDEVRYRLTVEVETPEGLKKGSGVMGFKIAPGFPQSYSPTFRGEAIPVDLGARGILFMTLARRSEAGTPQSNVIGMLPERVFRRTGLTARIPKEKRSDRVETLNFLADQVRAKAELQCVHQPFNGECLFFVRFRDINDPASVEAVDPDNLAASFGDGVRLRPVTIEITDEKVTRGNVERLRWLTDYDDKQLDGEKYNTSSILANSLNRTDFRMGE